MTRTDLLALTPEVLASLANRGLVKRAEKDLAAGTGPEVTADPDGTVRGAFPDGTETVLLPGSGLEKATCTCAAPGVCRHRIGVVLAYRRTTDRPPEQAWTDWSPGGFDDAALTTAFGRAALTAARRTADRGFTARLRRPTAEHPAPRVELPACTVSFPVPHDLTHALTDASAAARGEAVALAVWAFRAGDEQGTTEVSVGGRTTSEAPAGNALTAAVALADALLLDGVRTAGPVFAGALERAHGALRARAAHWPAGAVAELREQLDAYTARSARYRAERLAFLLTELHARARAAAHDPVGVLGTREASQTPLRRVRLVALGARIGGTARDRTAEVYFAHADAGLTLVLRRRWDLTEDETPTGHELGARRILRSPLRALATANVVSENTSRAPDRTVVLARGRIAATDVTPVGTAWTELPDPLLVHDAAAHLSTHADRPPRLIRPRVEADAVRVLAVDGITSYGYDPAAQTLEATLRDPAGNGVLLRAAYNPLSPGGLDALAAALDDGRISHVSGLLTRAGGRPVLDPLAVLTPTGVIALDLAPGAGDAGLPTAPPRPADPVTGALDSALTTLSEAAHAGLRHTTPAHLTRTATQLHRVGLHTASDLIGTLAHTLTTEGAQAAVPAWVTAQIHLITTAELHQEGPETRPV
ncbi:hypothetical protein SRB5_21220 [Streptomyces sp. RB5]|uniref:SWIM-type domain-containing protein n=1 Tax=Streptomyces smaragdinus TaxID=2585196 RepID=A0A7K0CGX0_9ACTN|nr:hypothetical protein [Streptomyces smaragdinus]MQY11994.1 hypothetical protein [Streptomyces smaragdinus]